MPPLHLQMKLAIFKDFDDFLRIVKKNTVLCFRAKFKPKFGILANISKKFLSPAGLTETNAGDVNIYYIEEKQNTRLITMTAETINGKYEPGSYINALYRASFYIKDEKVYVFINDESIDIKSLCNELDILCINYVLLASEANKKIITRLLK